MNFIDKYSNVKYRKNRVLLLECINNKPIDNIIRKFVFTYKYLNFINNLDNIYFVIKNSITYYVFCYSLYHKDWVLYKDLESNSNILLEIFENKLYILNDKFIWVIENGKEIFFKRYSFNKVLSIYINSYINIVDSNNYYKLDFEGNVIKKFKIYDFIKLTSDYILTKNILYKSFEKINIFSNSTDIYCYNNIIYITGYNRFGIFLLCIDGCKKIYKTVYSFKKRENIIEPKICGYESNIYIYGSLNNELYIIHYNETIKWIKKCYCMYYFTKILLYPIYDKIYITGNVITNKIIDFNKNTKKMGINGKYTFITYLYNDDNYINLWFLIRLTNDDILSIFYKDNLYIIGFIKENKRELYIVSITHYTKNIIATGIVSNCIEYNNGYKITIQGNGKMIVDNYLRKWNKCFYYINDNRIVDYKINFCDNYIYLGYSIDNNILFVKIGFYEITKQKLDIGNVYYKYGDIFVLHHSSEIYGVAIGENIMLKNIYIEND